MLTNFNTIECLFVKNLIRLRTILFTERIHFDLEDFGFG